MSGSEGRNPVQDFKTINAELKKYSEKLSKRKQIVVANKIDAMQDEKLYKELEKVAKENKMEIFKISAATGEGISKLLSYVSEVLKTLPKEDLIETENEKVYTLEEKDNEYTIEKEDGKFVIKGEAVERIMRRVNIADNESLYYFQKSLDNLGVNERLKKMGVQEGDIVKIDDYELEWEE